MIDSYLVLLITSISCGVLGVFLVIREMSMVADAIAHSVLLGIVVAFFITKDVGSPLLIVGAGIFGLITVAAIEWIGKSKRVARSDAIGVVFPMFFSLSIILISKFARNSHIDTDVVLMGEVIFASLDTLKIGGLVLPVSFVKMFLIGVLNIGFISILYNHLKISSFDEEFALLLGIPVGVIFYSLMGLASLTAVVAFDSVGSVLVLSFFITPAATAYLISKDLKNMIFITIVVSVINCTIGTLLAVYYNASLTGMCAFIGMITFLMVLSFNGKGVVYSKLKERRIKNRVRRDMFIIHIGNHIVDGTSSEENSIPGIFEHLNWKREEINQISKSLIENGWIILVGNEFVLTNYGKKRYEFLKKHYKLGNEGIL